MKPTIATSLTTKHLLAASMLATGASQTEVARLIGFSKEHMSNLSRSPLFAAQVEQFRERVISDVVNGASAKLRGETVKNVEALVQIRDDKTISVNARLRAINSMLDRVPETATTQKIESKTGPAQLSDDQVDKLLAFLEDDPKAAEAFAKGASTDLMGLLSVDDSETEPQIMMLEESVGD